MTDKLTEKYRIISEFMKNNKLKLNDDKTHLLVMDTGQSNARNQENKLVEIRTSTDIIYPSSSGKLLGCWISNNLKGSSFKNRKMFAKMEFFSAKYLIT